MNRKQAIAEARKVVKLEKRPDRWTLISPKRQGGEFEMDIYDVYAVAAYTKKVVTAFVAINMFILLSDEQEYVMFDTDWTGFSTEQIVSNILNQML